jgi:hypothetical protein
MPVSSDPPAPEGEAEDDEDGKELMFHIAVGFIIRVQR